MDLIFLVLTYLRHHVPGVLKESIVQIEVHLYMLECDFLVFKVKLCNIVIATVVL